MFNKIKEKSTSDIWVYYMIGAVFTALFVIPYILLGEKSFVPYHDQLDGEVMNYIYRAKYLFSGSSVIPEFMNGMAKSSMVLPAPLGVLFYRLLPPFGAYVCMQLVMMLGGYTGMFLLAMEMTGQKAAALVTAVLFAFLPVYPVYGLAILGQPLLIWGFLQLYKNKNRFCAYVCIVSYALFSSMVLVGFAWICAGVLLSVLLLARKERRRQGLFIATGTAALTAVYLLCNADILTEFLGIGQSYATHREEMVQSSVPLTVHNFMESWIGNGIYVPTCAEGIALFALVLLAAGLIGCLYQKSRLTMIKGYIYYKRIAVLLLVTVCVALAGQLWNIAPVVALRERLGGIFVYFQASRISWTLPVWWFMILAFCLALVNEVCRGRHLAVKLCIAAVPILMVGKGILDLSPLKKNVKLVLFPDSYEQITWEDIYCRDIFEQISEKLPEDKSGYRVASLGIYPSAALYNGFYCLDGYSNNYSLEYKHQFRRIISGELAKNEETRAYFDEWGNRCYVVTGETGFAILIGKKDKISLDGLQIDVEQFKTMGGRYLFSAVPIENAEELGITLLDGSPFSTKDSYYEIWVYIAG